MAKTERLTKKRVLELFKQVDFQEDQILISTHPHSQRILTETGLGNFIRRHREALQGDRRGEAGERELVDNLVSELNDIFGEDIRGIVTRQANARFFYARAQAERNRLTRLTSVYSKLLKENTERKEAEEKTAAEQQKTVDNLFEQVEAGKKTLKDIDARLEGPVIKEELAALRKERDAARLRDQAAWYEERFKDAYIGKGIRSLFRRLPKDPQDIIDVLKPLADEAGAVCPYIQVEGLGERKKGFAEIEAEANIKAYIKKVTGIIPDLRTEQERSIGLSAEEQARVQKALDETRERIAYHTEQMANAKANERYIAGQQMEDPDFALAAENAKKGKGAMLAFAQRELERLIKEDANPLQILAYEAFIDARQEQERILEDFRETKLSWFPLSKRLEDIEDQQVVDTLESDLNLEDPNYMDIALEHYMAAAYIKAPKDPVRSAYEDRAYRYFSRYLPNLRGQNGRFAMISAKADNARVAMETFVEHSLNVDIVKHQDATFDPKSIKKYTEMLDKRVEATHRRLEVINPEYDRLQRYNQNPALARFMALTMAREEIINIQRGLAKDEQGQPIAFTEEHEIQLAAIAKEMVSVMETTKVEGTYIDLQEAASIATETLIPGYDQVREFAAMQYPKLDLSKAADRAVLRDLEADFQAQLQMNHINTIAPEKMIAYMEIMGVDTSKQEDIDAYIAANRSGILEYFSKGGTVYPASLEAYKDLLADPAKLAADPTKLAEIYQAFGSKDLKVEYNPTTRQFTLASGDNKPVVIPPERLADKDFMKTMGMILENPEDKELQAVIAADAGISIAAALDKRADFVMVSTEVQDMGLLGHSAFALNNEEDYAKARVELGKMLTSPAAWAAHKEQMIAAAKAANQPAPTTEAIRAALFAKYQAQYAELLDTYNAHRAEIQQMKNPPVQEAPKTTTMTSEATFRTEKRTRKGQEVSGTKKTLFEKFNGKTVKKKDGTEEHKPGFLEAIKTFDETEKSPEAQAMLDQAVAMAFGATLEYINTYNLSPEVIAALNEQLKAQGIAITPIPALAEDGKTPLVDENNNPIYSGNSIVRETEGSIQTFTLGQDGKVNVVEQPKVQAEEQGGGQ